MKSHLRDLEEVLSIALQWRQDGHQIVLASVLSTWGSSPRPVGAMMVVCDDGRFEGSVSGGCVEGAVIQSALEHMNHTKSQRLSFDVAQKTAWEVGLACGGRIDVLLWPTLEIQLLADLHHAHIHREAPSLVLQESTGEVAHVTMDGLTDWIGPELVQRKRSGQLMPDVVVQRFIPRPRVVLVGAVHVAQALAPMAIQTGFDVIVIDPRAAFTQAARFDDLIDVRTCWPQEWTLELDAQCAIVCLSHDPKIDDPALREALASPAFYIGALGSRKSHAKRLERLNDVEAHQLDRIHGPVGLFIGSVTAPEIAVSILAEIIKAWRLNDEV